MKKDLFFKKIEGTVGLKIVNSFKNEFGETYYLYLGSSNKQLYITGDEFDYEMGNKIKRVLLPDSLYPIYFAVKDKELDGFTFNSEEQKKLHEILGKSIFLDIKKGK
jgi:hypothetical protein